MKRIQVFTIRKLAKVIGTLVAAFPGVIQGPLYYRQLDMLKSKALEENSGNFDALTCLTEGARKELDWWIFEVDKAFFPLEFSDLLTLRESLLGLPRGDPVGGGLLDDDPPLTV